MNPRWRWRNVPVPEPFVGGLALDIPLQIILPWRLLPQAWMGHAVGWPLGMGGVLLVVWAVASVADLDIDSPSTVALDGPYVFSRNPMYVGWAGMYFGITFVVNSVWLLILTPVVLGLIHLVVLREERALERRFGAEYAAYRGRTRRYL